MLIAVELNTSQDFVRNYFTDIEGPVPFYAVNTTISVFLLWSTSLLFIVCYAALEHIPGTTRLRWFCLSQVFIFAFLGFDDRFKVHEGLAWRLGIDDHYILIVTAAMELTFLFWLGGWRILWSPAGSRLSIAALLFVIMIVIDACFPHDMVLRLTLEDLAKTWAALFFALFAWKILDACMYHLRGQDSWLFRAS